MHGNAMLSRFDMSDCRAIEHRCGDLSQSVMQDKSHHPSHLHICTFALAQNSEPANTS